MTERHAILRAVPVLGLGVLLLTGCAATNLPSPGRETREQIEALEDRVLALQRKATVNEVELARLRQQVATLEARLGQRSATTPAAESAPVPLPSIEEAAPPAVSRAEVEEDEIDVPPVRPRPDSPAERGPVEPSDRPPPAGPEVTGIRPLDRSGQELYDEAYTLYHEGRYDAAEEAFRRFLDAYPATELSDNAQYWIGAARFAAGDYPGALRAFRDTVESYPEGNKVPDALYKIGQSLEAVGDAAGAREVYQELRRRFPDTAASSLAADRLEALRR